MYHNDRCTVGIAAHQAARKGRPRVAADAEEGPPPPRTKAQRGKKLLLGLRAVPALRTVHGKPFAFYVVIFGRFAENAEVRFKIPSVRCCRLSTVDC